MTEPSGPRRRASVDAAIVRAFSAARDDAGDRLSEVHPDADVWRELDLDSMDNVAVLTHLSRTLGCDIPERDLPLLLTLRSIRVYVDDRLP